MAFAAMTAHPRLRAERLGTPATLVAVVAWGFGNILVKYIRLSGLAVAFNRMILGAIVFTLLLYATGGRLSRRSLWLALPGGVAFGVDMALFFVAIKHTSVADASIITALQPALVFLVAGRLFGERIGLRTVGWSAVAVAGVTISVLGSASAAGRTLDGDLLSAASLLAWAWYFVASKQCRQKLGAFEYQAAMTIVAAVVIAPLALATTHDLVIRDASTFGWVLLMVVVPGGGHLLMNWAHRYAAITLASLVTLGIPVVATAGAAVLLSEPVTLVQAAGMALVIASLTMILIRPPTSPAEVAPPPVIAG